MTTLRSNYAHGSPRWFTRRTQWRALGIGEEDLEKPKIAVVNSSSKLAPCFTHLDDIAAAVCDRLAELGAVGLEIRTVAPTDFLMAAGKRGGYVLSSRDLLVNDIEAPVEGAQLDGMICLSSCDKTTPAHLMAAMRLDVPTVVVPCGYQRSGTVDPAEPVDIEEVFIQAGHIPSGRSTFERVCAISDAAIQGPGVCSGMGTANTMHCVAEALGMTVPGAAPVAANSDRMWSDVDRACAAIVDAVQRGITPRSVMTESAIENAVALTLAIGGSINAIKHLQAIAAEGGVAIDVTEAFHRWSQRIDPLVAVRPNGQTTIEQFDAAGGARAVLQRLSGVIDAGATTVMGGRLDDGWPATEPGDASVIHAVDAPVARHSLINIVSGSLAPHGAVVKLSAAESRQTSFRGEAQVFADAQDAIAAINDGRVVAGTVLVLRGLGPRGCPGMGMASNVVFALNGSGLTQEVAVVTDGQLSGLVNKGIVAGEVKPEGVWPSPLSLVENGDTIAIDVEASSIDLLVDTDELARRAERPPAPREEKVSNWLDQYASAVSPLERGAVLVSNVPNSAPTAKESA